MGTGLMAPAEHPWFPRTSCDDRCVQTPGGHWGESTLAAIRQVRRITVAAVLLLMMPVLAAPLPSRVHARRWYCRAFLRALGLRITLSGRILGQPGGVLVVSNHVSWLDVFAISAVIPGNFVARADLVDWPAVGLAARLAKVIPIERSSLRQLPGVVSEVGDRLRQGKTVVAFPEGTTYCGRDHGQFRPALFQAALDAARPVQPLRLTYHHRDGSPSTVTAFLGDDRIWASLKRIARARRTVVHVQARRLELPRGARRELAARCESAVRTPLCEAARNMAS